MQELSPVERAKQIIAENRYMTVATSSLDGKPWISPVSFVCDDDYNFFWVSGKNTKHSSLIRNNCRVAITIFHSDVQDEDVDGVYLEAEASELESREDIEHAIKTLWKRPKADDLRVKEIGQVTGNNVWRIYRAIPKLVHKLMRGEHIGGQYVDRHIEISLTGET